MRKLVGTVLLLLALNGAAQAREKWVEVSSPHFKVLTDAPRYEGLQLAEHFEKMRETFSALLRAHPADTAPMLVIALRNRKEFRAIEPAAYLGRGKLDLAGYFAHQGTRDYILLRLDTEGPHPYATIYHEYTHYLLRDDYTWLPLWLNEGLAEFYQNTDIHPGEVDLGQPDMGDLMYLRQNRMIPVSTLVQITASSPYYHEEQKGSIFYAESWALVHYLIVTDRQNGTLRLETYEKDLKSREDSLTAARNAFGSLKELDAALRRYLNSLSYAYFRLKLQTRVDKQEFKTRDEPETEAEAIEAGVLVDNHRVDDARAMLKKALQEDPNSAVANQMMGYLELRAGNFRAAENWYAGALAMNPESYEVNYRFAECAMRNADETEDAKVEASLRNAMHLNPKFAPAYDLLAQFYDIHQEHEHEAHILEAQAISLEPENVQYRLNAAVGLANQGDFANALRVLDTARHVARNHMEMAMIQAQTLRMKQLQQMMQREKKAETGMRADEQVLANGSSQQKRAPYRGLIQREPMQPTVTTKQGSGPVVSLLKKAPEYPGGPPTGARHTVTGVVKEASCYYPSMLVLTVDAGGKSLIVYRHNYFDVKYSAVGVEIKGELHPCTDLVGKRARIEYAAVKKAGVAGQMLTVQLVK